MTKEVAVLGQGQLGAMLRRAGERIGLDITLLAPDAPELPGPDTIITVESEHWPDNAGTRALAEHPGWRNARALALLPDRRAQKQLLDDLKLPTAPWCIPEETTDVEALKSRLGDSFLLKVARGGYDGRGQYRVSGDHSESLPEWKTEAIAEARIGFDTEVSLIGARSVTGEFAFYPLTENLHVDGTLSLSIGCSDRFRDLQVPAEAMLKRLMTELDYTGVMAMECFVVDGKLVINELAPRVHNSGHWTQAGTSICQFELHLRALLGWPLPRPEAEGFTVMVNLLGMEYDPAWLAVPGARVYWYKKSVRPGRKMGHINLHHRRPSTVADWLECLPLPDQYRASKEWALKRLSAWGASS